MHRTYILFLFLSIILLHPKAGEGVQKNKLSDSLASFIGEAKYDNSSGWFSTVGDVNGDGFDDLMIGARNNDEGGDNAGKCYLFFGKSSGWKMDLSLSDADVAFIGEGTGDQAGFSGSMLGDVNGDGIDDFILGASYHTSSDGENIGKSYLFFGKTSGWEKKYPIAASDVKFIGERDLDHSANALTYVGDVNGDGLNDFLIAAMNNDNGGENAGKVYLLLGKTKWSKEIRLSWADASFIGKEKGDKAGQSIAYAGDVNGDGYDDFLIGAPNNNEGGSSSGQVYLILGKKDGWRSNIDLSRADVTLRGAKGDGAGSALSTAGDVDNDGLSDFLISAPNNSEEGRKTGKVFLFYGRREGWKRNILLKEADASFVGEKKNDTLGRSLAFCKDVDGDGIDDFLLGAPRNSEGGSKAGKIYLFLGKEGERFPIKTNVSATGYHFLGEKRKDYAGTWTSFGGDVDGDGIMEFLVGAESNSEGGKSAGQGYLIKLRDNSQPTQIKAVSFKSDATFEKPLNKEVNLDDTLYLEILAEDTDPDKINLLSALVSTNKLNCISIPLVETDINSGIFRGCFRLSDTGSGWLTHRLGVKSGNTIIATAATNRTKYAMVSLKVAFAGHLIDDDESGESRGNNNQHLEPGEKIELKLKLINHYFETVKGIRADITCSDPYVTLITNEIKFKDIPTGASALSQNSALLSLAEDTPTKHIIPFKITVTDSLKNQWDDTFVIKIEEIISISGQITDQTTHQALSGVLISSNLGASSVSDEAGHYKIHIAKPDSDIKLTFSYPDYLNRTRYFEQANLEKVGKVENVNIDLQQRISLENADISIVGENVRDASGASVSYAGDVNGDGYSDILVGAWSNDYGGTDAGKVYLIFGKPGDSVKKIMLSQTDVSFIGEKPYDEAGRNLAGVGDVNRDGFDDFIIGASGNDESGDKAGQSYLILGKATGWANNVPLYYADASFLGQKPYDRAGVASAAGDVNGDGYDDFIISGWSSDVAGIDSGQVYLIFGKPTGWEMDTPLNIADASFVGEYERDEAGKAVAWAGDVNGDGYDDILIGAPSNKDNKDFSGKTYLILGRPKGWRWHLSLNNADASFLGEDSNDAAGSSLCGLGDVNGDGYDDFLIGSWSNDSGGADAGKAYLFLGKPIGWHPNTLLSTADATFIGEEAKDAAALSISFTGDINGDGYNDIFIGAWGNNYGKMDNGQSYVILGKHTGWKNEMSLKEADYSFYGKEASDYAGRSISYAGDFNGDGIDDLLIGAWGSNAGQEGAGESYLMFVSKNIPPKNIESIKLNIADSFSMPDPLELETQKSLYSDQHLAFLEENWSSHQDSEGLNPLESNQLYVMLQAEDTQPDKINVAEVILNSTANIHDLPLRLYETDYNSGKFLGRIKIASTSSSQFSRRILAYGQNPLIISSKENGAKFSRIFVQDTAPPIVNGLKPDDQERLVSISSTLTAHIKDPGSGVDKESIRMTVNNKSVPLLIEGDPSHYRLTYTPEEFFPYGNTVKTIVSAGDRATPPNVVNFTYSFHVADKGILLNPSFEQDLTNWNFITRPGVSLSIDSTVAHSGLKSCKFEFNGTEDIKYQQFSQGPIPVKPDTGYLVQCYMKTENLTSNSGMRIYVEGSRLSGRKTDRRNYFNKRSGDILGTNDWEKMTVSFETKSDTTDVFIYVIREDRGEPIAGTCWLDDFYMMEESEDGYTGSKIKSWFFDFLTE